MLQPDYFAIGKRRNSRPHRPDRIRLRGGSVSHFRRAPVPLRVSLSIGERASDRASPICRRAGRSSLDFALLPGDRQSASGVDSLPDRRQHACCPTSIGSSAAASSQPAPWLREARDLGARYEVRPNDPSREAVVLSGGNAQKVLVARWMNRNPKLLLLDEPTQGVDVGTRVQIYAALRAAAAAGMSIVCASSDAEQLAEICDRVLVFARGRICAEITGARTDQRWHRRGLLRFDQAFRQRRALLVPPRLRVEQ